MKLFVMGALAGMLGLGLARAEEPAVKKIEVMVKLEGKGRPTAPVVVASAAELEKAIPDETARKEIAKQVDFKKHKLAIFAWSGSGQDNLAPEVKDTKEIVFTYLPGRTRDLRSHVAIFAFQADHTVKLAK